MVPLFRYDASILVLKLLPFFPGASCVYQTMGCKQKLTVVNNDHINGATPDVREELYIACIYDNKFYS